MSDELLKRCEECGDEHPLLFFRRAHYSALDASSAQRRHPKCIACEQDANDETKRKDRWTAKARDTIRRHAKKYGISPAVFMDKFGWDVPRVTHILKHASENTCCYCRDPYEAMGHGPADITMDIIDPRKEPYLDTNAQPCCATCNRRKGNRTPEEWSVILRCWRKHDQRKRLLLADPMMRYPLWQAASSELSSLKRRLS
jgi:5-methylcytosine-specific restriction endonuclease McrA